MTRIEALTKALRGAHEGGRRFTLTPDEAALVADVLELSQAIPVCRHHLSGYLARLRGAGEAPNTAHAVANLLTGIGDADDLLG